MRFTVQNTGRKKAEVELAGWLENAVCLHSGEIQSPSPGQPHRLAAQGCGFSNAAPNPQLRPRTPKRPDIVFDDFEREDYSPWTASGTAFGPGPITQAQVPDYQGDLNIHGRRAVNSHAAAPDTGVNARDAATGTLTSPPFTIERHFIHCLIGGGAHQGRTCLNLLVDGKTVASLTGANANRMEPRSMDVRRWAGQTARLEIVDEEPGGWGNIGVDNIVFSDQPATPPGPLEQEGDFGTMGLALLDAQRGDRATAELAPGKPAEQVFNPSANRHQGPPTLRRAAHRRAEPKAFLAAGCQCHRDLPGHLAFPEPQDGQAAAGPLLRHALRFGARRRRLCWPELRRLSRETRLWHDTWYDSTLPYWFLDRTFLNTSILATSTCFRFGDGRF